MNSFISRCSKLEKVQIETMQQEENKHTLKQTLYSLLTDNLAPLHQVKYRCHFYHLYSIDDGVDTETYGLIGLYSPSHLLV